MFILDLIEAAPDITLAEIAERLAGKHGVRVVPSTIWMVLDRRGVTLKKRRRMPQSSNVPTFCVAAEPGSRANSISLIFIDETAASGVGVAAEGVTAVSADRKDVSRVRIGAVAAAFEQTWKDIEE